MYVVHILSNKKSSSKKVLNKDAKKGVKQVAGIQFNALVHPYFTLIPGVYYTNVHTNLGN